MAKTLLGGCYANDFPSVNTNTNCFLALGMNGERVADASVAETNTQIKLRHAGTLSLLTANVFNNAQTAAGSVQFRQNTANGNQVLSIGATTAGQFQDATHSDSIASGDLVDIMWKAPSAFHAFQISALVMAFDATGATATLLSSSDDYGTGAQGPSAASTTYFAPLAGTGGGSAWFSTSEANLQSLVRAAGTVSNLAMAITANTSTNGLAVTFRDNGTSGNGTFTVPAATTGYFEDTTHSDSVVSGDLINITAITGAGTVNQKPSTISALFVSSAGNYDLQGGQTQTSAAASFQNANNFGPILGALGSVNAFVAIAEGNVQCKVPVAFTASRMRIRLAINSFGSNVAMALRDNGADVNGALTITAATTGYFEDATHSDSVAANDLVCWRIGAVSSAGAMVPSKFGLTMTSSASATVSLTGVAATAAAHAAVAGPQASPAGVQAAGAAHTVLPQVGVTAGAAQSIGSRGNLVFGSVAPLAGVSAAGMAGAVRPIVRGVPAGVAAVGFAGRVAGTQHLVLVGVQAIARAGGSAPTGSPTLRGVQAFALASEVGLYATPISYVPAARIMRNTPVPTVGHMGNMPVAVVARLFPSGPQPRSRQVTLRGVAAVCKASTVSPFFNVSVHITGVQAVASANPVIGAGNMP